MGHSSNLDDLPGAPLTLALKSIELRQAILSNATELQGLRDRAWAAERGAFALEKHLLSPSLVVF